MLLERITKKNKQTNKHEDKYLIETGKSNVVECFVYDMALRLHQRLVSLDLAVRVINMLTQRYPLEVPSS